MWSVTKRFLQFFIGGIIVASALGKALDLSGFVEVLKTYQAFPDLALWPLAVLVTIVEFAVGGWILSGRHLRAGALMAAALNAAYMLWMIITLLRGLRLSNCGCFGVFLPLPLTWASPATDLILVGLCYLLSRLADGDGTGSRYAPR